MGRGKDRLDAIKLLQVCIKDLNIIGPETNTKYLEAILGHSDYQKNQITVEFCRNNHNKLIYSYINKSDSSPLNYLISFALYLGYFGDDQIETTDPWKHLGYWRLSVKQSNCRLIQKFLMYKQISGTNQILFMY